VEQRGDIEYVTLDTQIKTRQTPTPFAADSYPDALGDVTHSNRINGHERLDPGPVQPWQTILVLSLVSALWLVVAVYFLGDISAHFNPATTLALALRKDLDWIMAAGSSGGWGRFSGDIRLGAALRDHQPVGRYRGPYPPR
jgi:Major intrinsic protein